MTESIEGQEMPPKHPQAEIAEKALALKDANCGESGAGNTHAAPHVEIEPAQIETVRVRVLPDGRMDSDNAAKYLGRKSKTLAMWRMEGRGPAHKKIAGRIFYFQKDLDAFIGGDTAPAPAAA